MTLAREFQKLVDQGLIVPATVAPVFVPLTDTSTLRMKTVYSIGEAKALREVKANAKLGASSRRDTNRRG